MHFLGAASPLRVRLLSLAVTAGIPAALLVAPGQSAHLVPPDRVASPSGQGPTASIPTISSRPKSVIAPATPFAPFHSASAGQPTQAPPPAPSDAPQPSPVLAPSPSAPPVELPTSGLVGRSGTELVVNGQPYHFTGINIYMAASGGTPSSCGGELYPNVGVPLSDMSSGIVIRFWAFQDFFVSNGSFNWSNFDTVLQLAAQHHDRVIPVLANQYAYCDGPAKDLAWYQSGYKTTVAPGDLVPYRQYVADVVSRYAGNPTIAMWQLVNEGQAVNDNGSCSESAALSALLSFSNDVGGLIHTLDPHHLVSLGTLAGYSGSGLQWCGAANSDYQTLMASPGNDVCDFHDYGFPSSPMGNPQTPDLATAIQMCHADGKPIMVAETGIFASAPDQLAPRASEFRAKFYAQFQAGVVGELMWDWANIPAYVYPPADPDYGIFPASSFDGEQADPSLALLGRIYW